VPAREDTYPKPLACEVRQPVPFFITFISPVMPQGIHSLLGEQRAQTFSQGLESDLNHRPTAQEMCSNRYANLLWDNSLDKILLCS